MAQQKYDTDMLTPIVILENGIIKHMYQCFLTIFIDSY
jgi:hypothetical protein